MEAELDRIDEAASLLADRVRDALSKTHAEGRLELSKSQKILDVFTEQLAELVGLLTFFLKTTERKEHGQFDQSRDA